MEANNLTSVATAFASKTYSGMDKSAVAKKAHEVAADFESVYIGDAFKAMFKDVSVDPLNGKSDNSNETWRDMMIDQYAKDFVKKGGIGIADGIAAELIKIQEGHAG